MTEKAVTSALSGRSVDLLNSIADLLIDPANLIPLLFAFGIGWLYSLSPSINRMKRVSDKKFRIYSCNFVVSICAFMLLHYKADLSLLLSSIMFVGAASILLPAVYFRWFHK
jgi:hypothetical protein